MAADPLAIQAYYGILSVNITTKKTLAQVLIDAYAALATPQTISNIPGCEVLIYANTANAVDVFVGDEELSTTNYAYRMEAKQSRRYGPLRTSAVPLSNIYVMSADGVTAVKIGLEIIPA